MEPEGSLSHSKQHATCPYPEPDWSSQCPFSTSRRSILILSSNLHLGLPNNLLPSCIPIKTLYATLYSPIRSTCPAHLITLFWSPQWYLWEVQCTNLPVSLHANTVERGHLLCLSHKSKRSWSLWHRDHVTGWQIILKDEMLTKHAAQSTWSKKALLSPWKSGLHWAEPPTLPRCIMLSTVLILITLQTCLIDFLHAYFRLYPSGFYKIFKTQDYILYTIDRTMKVLNLLKDTLKSSWKYKEIWDTFLSISYAKKLYNTALHDKKITIST